MAAAAPGVVTEEGLLLPVRPPGRMLPVALGFAALLLLAGGVVLAVLAFLEGRWSNLVGVLVLLAVALLFALAALGMLRVDRSGSTGLLLTPSQVRLTDRAAPIAIPWEGIVDVRDTSPLVEDSDESSPGWLAFITPGEPEPGLEDELRVMSGSPYPSVQAAELVAGRDAARELCRYYLMRPESRAELATPVALERLAELGA